MVTKLKTQIGTKLKNSNCEEKNSKTQTVTKLKLWQNSKWEEKKQKKSQFYNSNYDKKQKLKLWQNSKTQIMSNLNLWEEKKL